jgi:hypothetical protein
MDKYTLRARNSGFLAIHVVFFIVIRHEDAIYSKAFGHMTG